MKKVKIKYKRDFATGFIKVVNDLIEIDFRQDDMRLMVSALVEVRQRMLEQTVQVKKEYTMTLTPVQAIATSMLHKIVFKDPTTYMGSKLMLISGEVEKTFTK